MLSTTTDYRGNPYNLTLQQITDIINADPTRTPAYGTPHTAARYRVLDGRTLAAIPMSNTNGPWGIDDGDITDLVSGCQLTMSTPMVESNRDILTTANITMFEDPTRTFDPDLHVIQPLVQYWDGPVPPLAYQSQPQSGPAPSAGSRLLMEIPASPPLCFVEPDRDIAPSGPTWTCAMSDIGAWIGDCDFINSYGIPASTNFAQWMTALLLMDGIPLSLGGGGQSPSGLDDAGPGYPLARINITPDPRVTPAPISFEIGTGGKLAAINSGADSIIYQHIWLDALGRVNSHPLVNLDQGPPTTVWEFVSHDASTIFSDVVQQRFPNATDRANIVVAFRQNPACASELLRATAYNANASQSRIAITRLHRPRMVVIRDDNAPDLPSLQQEARQELQRRAWQQEVITLSTMWMHPLLQPYDFVNFTLYAADGQTVLIGSDNGFQVVSWNWDLGSTTGSLTLQKLVQL